MIDIHCHILPGIDDGPETVESSVEMCRMAAADGIRTVVATPHFRPGSYDCADIAERITALETRLRTEGLKLTILPGADVSVTPELFLHIQREPRLTINAAGRYMLVELPQDVVPSGWERFLLAVRQHGITPILTHPERNRWFLRHPEAIVPFVLGGGLVQITAMSMTKALGKEIYEYCCLLLRKNLVQVIATDAHSPDWRPPILSEARRAAAAVVGEEMAARLVHDVPLAIISGQLIDMPEPILDVPRKKRWYQRVLDL